MKVFNFQGEICMPSTCRLLKTQWMCGLERRVAPFPRSSVIALITSETINWLS